MKYKVIGNYTRKDNTGDNQEVDYPIHPGTLETLKDARKILSVEAYRKDMAIRDYGLRAEKESINEDIETGIIVIEIETLRIEKVV